MAGEGTVSPPSGTVTFLFTDIEGSTWLVQHLGDDYDRSLHDHNRLLREAWSQHGGFEVSTEGDAFFVTFADPMDAVAAALDGQRRLARHSWTRGAQLRVRMGIHTGEARVYDGDYVGLAVHQAARVAAAAHGGQVIVSEATRSRIGTEVEVMDLGLHRLKDLAHPIRLFQLASADLESDFPSPRTLTIMPNNFPLQTTTFVGRDDDIVEVRRLLSDERLVTLTGAGGVGKTRLAIQVGAEVIDDFPDGAWLVDLAPLADPMQVGGALADVLGVREQQAREIAVAVTDDLLTKQLLIVLDNCEHVIDACAQIVHRILGACPLVRFLATSREALNVSGETAYRLRSLAVPDADGAEDLGDLARAESVRLFTQRARTVRSRFDLTAENASAIAQICRRLDGLPLAIELAAARVKAMAPGEIAARLDDRFRLLTGGTRIALPRQRTLEATVSWSYDLLSEAEQLVFERLSVFAGGCTVEAAERVCGGEDVDPQEVFELLCRLVDRSLLIADAAIDGRTRYRLLETLRQFGRDRLLLRGQVVPTRDRHLAWMVGIASALPPQTGATLPPEIVAESDNIHAAIEWAIETDAHESALLILADVWNFGVHFDQRARWYEQILPSAERMPSDVAARVLAGAGGLAFMMGDWELSAARNHAAAEAARAVDNSRTLALGLLYEGASLWGMSDDDNALLLLEEGLDVARTACDSEMIRRGMIFMAWAQTQRDLENAFDVANRVDLLSRQEGTRFDQAHAREVLGYVHALRGDVISAASTLAEALPLFEEVLLSCSSHVLETSAAFAAMIGRAELGAELWGASDRLREESGDRPRPWEREVQEVWLPKIRQDLDPATFEAAWARGQEMGRDDALAYAELQLRA